MNLVTIIVDVLLHHEHGMVSVDIVWLRHAEIRFDSFYN